MNGWFRPAMLALALACGAACGTVRQRPSTSQAPEPRAGDFQSPSAAASVEPPSGESKSPARRFQKWNPLWWFGNADDPVPPDWYRPGSPCRHALWQLRNPLHNFTFYVIGVADKCFTRTGRFPDAVFAPDGGWNWAVTRCGWTRLPFVSFSGARWRFYLGWRERGNFGGKINFGKLPSAPDPGRHAPNPNLE